MLPFDVLVEPLLARIREIAVAAVKVVAVLHEHPRALPVVRLHVLHRLDQIGRVLVLALQVREEVPSAVRRVATPVNDARMFHNWNVLLHTCKISG